MGTESASLGILLGIEGGVECFRSAFTHSYVVAMPGRQRTESGCVWSCIAVPCTCHRGCEAEQFRLTRPGIAGAS